MKALMDSSWVNGWRQSLKVPSTYQVLALLRWWSCCSVAKIRCWWSRIWTSARRKSSGMWSSSRSNSRLVGSFGRSCCRTLLAARAKWDGLDKAGHGASVNSSRRTYDKSKIEKDQWVLFEDRRVVRVLPMKRSPDYFVGETRVTFISFSLQ